MRNLVISNDDLLIGLVLAVVLLATWALSIGAIIQPNHITIGLVILNWTLIVDAIGIMLMGSWIWFYTLQERANFHVVFAAQTPAIQSAIQDKLQCCGYFNSTDLLQIGGSFCQNQTFANTLNSPCVGPITAFADMTLNNIFTTIYGYMAIAIALFLASLCVINVRLQEERFKKIDEKRGGRGFV